MQTWNKSVDAPVTSTYLSVTSLDLETDRTQKKFVCIESIKICQHHMQILVEYWYGYKWLLLRRLSYTFPFKMLIPYYIPTLLWSNSIPKDHKVNTFEFVLSGNTCISIITMINQDSTLLKNIFKELSFASLFKTLVPYWFSILPLVAMIWTNFKLRYYEWMFLYAISGVNQLRISKEI